MTLSPIICWGAKGQARVLREFFPTLGYDLIACFDNDPSAQSPFHDVPLVGDWSAFANWREQHAGEIACVVAIGGDHGKDRFELQQRLSNSGLTPATLIHPTAFVAASATIGAGSQILALSALCADARLGDACIINTHASVDHECTLGRGVHIGPGATVCGEVLIEDFVFVGAGATILPRLRIESGATIGAGAVVTGNVSAGSCVVGVPAHVR
jgi:sugar O-acyltransferase (sialic acid O-acetyltransferase NeuD family)